MKITHSWVNRRLLVLIYKNVLPSRWGHIVTVAAERVAAGRVIKIRNTQTVPQLSLQITDSIRLRQCFKLLTIEVYCHFEVETKFIPGAETAAV